MRAWSGVIVEGCIGPLSIPLPPLAEQRRIVAHVEKLMTICDQLEARLAASQVQAIALLEAVLHSALLSPADPIHMKSAISAEQTATC
jgi:type I restriction enzyme S subunit